MAKKDVDKLTAEIDAPDNRWWYKPFLTQLAEFPNVTKACAHAGISRAAAYKARDEEERFREAWDACVDAAIDDLEEAAFRRANESSDVLAKFLLSAHRPDKYRETQRHEHTGENGGNIVLKVVYSNE